MNDNDQPGWSSWVASSYGVYGPFLSPLEVYRAERQAESLDRIMERLDEARQVQDDQRQVIRDSLAKLRQARQAASDQVRERLHRPAAAETSPVTPVRDRLRERRQRPTAHTEAGVSERLDEADDPGLWRVEELVPPAEAELVDEPPDPETERESDGQ